MTRRWTTAMPESELILKLRPLQEGAYTMVSLRGAIATVAQPKEVRSLLKVLSWWSGAPVTVALCVDGTISGAGWLEIWDDLLLHLRGRRLFRVRVISRTGERDQGSDHDR